MSQSSLNQQWDKYVTDLYPQTEQRGDVSWPGDEWGTEGEWQRHFDDLFLPGGVGDWKQAVEIGQGAGKYTKMVFSAAPECKIAAFDVSSEYLKICRSRMASEIESGSLALEHLKSRRSDEMILALERLGMVGKLDGFFSIDAMVHVDLQYLTAYFLTAAVALRKGGHLIMTLADASTDQGYDFLISRVSHFYGKQAEPIGKFEWVSQDIVRSLMAKLGFEIVKCESPPDETGRDILLVARLADPEAGRRASWALEHEFPEQKQRQTRPGDRRPVLEWPEVENARKYTVEFSLNRFGTMFEGGLKSTEIAADEERRFKLPPGFWSEFQPGRRLHWRVIADCPDRLRIANRGIVIRGEDQP